MRNLLLVVLAINVVIFMFYYYLPTENRADAVSIPAGVEHLVLLSEVDKATLTQDRSPVVAVEQVASKQVAKTKVNTDKCFTVGPFKEEKLIVSFQSKIKSEIRSASVRQRNEKLHWRYWVYLPAFASKQQAVNSAAELAKKGLKDYYVIARGEYKNHISLGHFKDKVLATRRFEKIKKMGYQPQISTIEKEYTLYWLDYVAKNERGLSNQVLEAFELEDSIHQFTRECKK